MATKKSAAAKAKSPTQAPALSPVVDAYIAKAAPFAQPILSTLRETVHQAVPGVTEEMKWSRPFFLFHGVILGNMSAFKAHCSFGLWGSEVTQELRADGVAQSGSMGSFGRITSLEDLPPKKQLTAYLVAAAKPISDGTRTTAWSRSTPRPKQKVAKPEAAVPEALAAALKKSKVAAKNFDALSPSCRREYCDWIADAKRDETRAKRVTQAIEWIAEGKSRNWKYETAK